MTLLAGENRLAGASVPTIINETLDVANTEEIITLPINTRKFSVKPRTSSHILKLAYTEGESGSKYLTVPSGGYWEDLVGIHQLKLFIQSPTAGAIVEIVAWK